MPTCYMLVGLPGTRKSSWVKYFYEKDNNQIIISSDYFIERFARLCKMTYDEAFPLVMTRGIPERFINKRIKKAIVDKCDVFGTKLTLR